MSDIPKEPKRSSADIAYTVVKAGVSAVPVAGGPAAELLGLIFGPPLEKRRERWLQQLADAIREVSEKVAELTPEKLAQEEAFITTALHATEIAVRTHQQEKIEALRNAVVNAALQSALDETLQHIFLNHVDSLTPSHLRMLACFNVPENRRGIQEFPYRGSFPDEVPPQLAKEMHAVHDQIISDLEQRGLITPGKPFTTTTGPNRTITIERYKRYQARRTTDLGKLFLEFISRKSLDTTGEKSV